MIGVLGGYPIYGFAVLLNLGVGAGLGLATWLARQRGLPPATFCDVALGTLAAAFIGGRLGYAVAHWPEYAPNIATVLYVWEGGLALPGAVTAGAFAAWLLLRLRCLPLGASFDAAAPALAIGQGIGRLGCVEAGCALGAPAASGSGLPWLLLADPTGVVSPRFPSQFVEAAGEVALGLVLLALWQRRLRPGTVGASYLIGYGLLRAAAEPFRADSTFLGPLPLALWWALLAVAAGVALSTRTWRSREPVGTTPDRASTQRKSG